MVLLVAVVRAARGPDMAQHAPAAAARGDHCPSPDARPAIAAGGTERCNRGGWTEVELTLET